MEKDSRELHDEYKRAEVSVGNLAGSAVAGGLMVPGYTLNKALVQYIASQTISPTNTQSPVYLGHS